MKIDYRENEYFRKFVTSYDKLNDNEKVHQDKKLAHFFSYIEDSMNKHFQQWCNSELLFLSLYSNHPTATQVAKLIMGIQDVDINPQYYDKSQKQTITPNEFLEWLKNRCGATIIMATRRNQNVAVYSDTIKMIASGEDMWEDACNETLKEC